MLKQLMGIMLPGEASIHPGEVASSAALGSVSQAMGGAGSVNPVKMAGAPLNAAAEAYLSRRAKKLGTTDVAAEGRDLMEKTGFPLNLAEETQDPWAKMILGFAYRNAYGQELAALDQKAKDTAALSMFKRLSGKLGQAGGFESKDFSEAAVKAGQASVKDIEDSLQKNSTEKFGFLNRPDAAVNDIPLANRNALLDREAQYYASMGTPDALRTAEGLRKMMAAPSTTNGVATGNARLVQKEMQEFGEEGYGRFGEDFYKNLSRAEQGRLSRSIWGALRKDLGAAAEGGNAKAQQLLEARKGTEELLSLRERLKEVPLIKLMESKGMLNKALTNEGFVGQEAIGKELLGGMKSGSITPSEISNMTKLMQAVNPGFHHDLARAVIDNAVQVGKAAGKTRPAGFSYADAAKALPSPEYLQAIYKDIWSPEGKSTGMKIHSDLTLLLKAIERAERVGQGIPHAPGTTVLGIMDNLMGGEFKSAAKQFAGQIYFPRKVGQIAMSKAAEMKAVADALKQKETGAPKQHFLRSYIGEQLPRVLPPAMYEVGAALPRSNRPEVGE
jgi:hypothetical protein